MKRVIYSGFIVSILCFAFQACLGESVDSLLNELEKAVDELFVYAKEVKTLSASGDNSDPAKALARLATVQKELEKHQQKIGDIAKRLGKYEDNMSSEQTERLMRIMLKMSEWEED